MKLQYYPDTDSLYVEFKPEPGTETLEVATDSTSISMQVER